MKQRNIIVLTYERLAELIGLNDEHQVIGCIADDPRSIRTSRIELVVSGPSCIKVGEGEEMTWIREDEFRQIMEARP